MKEKRFGILFSGGMTTGEAVINAFESERLTGGCVAACYTTSPNAGGIAKAMAHNIPVMVGPKSTSYATPGHFGDDIIDFFEEYDVDILYQLGWLPRTPNKVALHYGYGRGKRLPRNQHPGDLDVTERLERRPDFGDMYGSQVTAAVMIYNLLIRNDLPTTVSTVHEVSEDGLFDSGRVIRRVVVPYRSDDDISAVKAKLLVVEHENVIAAIDDDLHDREPVYFYHEQPLIPISNLAEWNRAVLAAKRLFPKG